MKLFKNKKGAFGLENLQQAAIAFVIVTIVIALGANLLADQQAEEVTNTAGCNATDTSSCGVAYNATGEGLTALNSMSSRLGLFVTVIVLVLIIAIISVLREAR